MDETWTVSKLIDWTDRCFKEGGIPEPRLDAEVLLSHALDCGRLDLYLRKDDQVEKEKLDAFRTYVEQRKNRKPVSYITSEKEFMGLSFLVNESVLIPRPETELVVEEAMNIIEHENIRICVDMCAGSGNIAVSVAKLSRVKNVYACDISEKALSVARSNASRHGVSQQVVFKRGDLFEPLRECAGEGSVDMIISNPPYVADGDIAKLAPEIGFEPRTALAAGPDGMDYYRRIIKDGAKLLRSGGLLVLELSGAGSGPVTDIALENGFKIERTIKDYSGFDRVLTARRA
ncbi:MAG: peptide chain release factor N(5)-glutamine methyltransferase [Endomicrobiales bacterium]|nr:peptide chain release factor N(5)-glutamine methyltransferase [Endomicrobiales bacterium]